MDKVIVVTGSSSGIGRAVAIAFAEAGAKVVLNGRRSAVLRSALIDARRVGDAVGVRADISTEVGAKKLLDEALRAFGRVDVLVNNAGQSGPKLQKAWRVRPVDWRRTLDVNATGPFLCASAFLSWMMAHDRAGRIVNVDSTCGSRAYPGLAPYGVSKSALRALTAYLAADTEETGIVVTGLELGTHQTEMTRARVPRREYQKLDSPETALPLFFYALNGPAELLHGRTLSENRFRSDCKAEPALNAALAAYRPMTPYMPRYQPDASPNAINLDFLENPNGAPASVQTVPLTNLERYPDPHSTLLRRALSVKLSLPEDAFTFGNGSSELIQRLIRTFARANEEVVSTDPTWPVFERFCGTLGVANRQVQYDGAGHLDLEEIASAVTPRTRLIYLVSPNNPLGVAIRHDAFLRFLQRIPQSLPIVVDEAYVDFSKRPDILRTIDIVRQTTRPLIGVRTFSKFFGLAGLRIGYAFAPPAVVDLLRRLDIPFALSSIAERAAVAALGDREHSATTLDVNHRGLRQMCDGLSRMGLATLTSDANFVMAESPTEPETVFDKMTEAGLHLPQVHWKGHIQLPIAKSSENRLILKVLARLKMERRR